MPKTAPFEAFSDAYEQWFETHRVAYELEVHAVKSLLPPVGRGLEVGVGSGRFAAPLGIAVGVEPSTQMAARARSRGIRVLKGVAENLPVSNASFDFVLMVTTICFVDDVGASLREALRVLRPGGAIVIGFVDRESELGKTYLQRKNDSRFYRSAIFFSTPEVLAHMSRSGFGSFHVRQTLIPGNGEKAIEDGFGRGAFVVARGVKEKRQVT